MIRYICNKKRACHAGARPKAFALLRSGTLKEPATVLPLMNNMTEFKKVVNAREKSGEANVQKSRNV